MCPSVAQAVRAASLPTIAISDTYRLAPWAEMLYSCDAKWWLHHAEALRFEGLKVTQDASLPFPQVFHIQSSGGAGFDENPARIRTGANSGYQALHIAVHAGASKVLMFGLDMHGDHFFGRHPEPLRNADPGVYARAFIPRFNELAPILEGKGVEVINCTPGSALTCFPIMDPYEALARAVPHPLDA